LEQGLLFPRFTHILGLSASVTSQVAEHMIAIGDGIQPDDFSRFAEDICKAGQPAGVSVWEAYVRKSMFVPYVASQL
jgi:hypothetical protein